MSDESFNLKLERAREHLHTIDVESHAWMDAKPCTSIDEPDPETPPEPVPDGYQARRLRIHKVAPAPPRLSILIGDCVFNLRSSLDHLALALAQKFTPGMTDKAIRNSQFPAWKTAPEPKQRNDLIGCIEPAAQSVIDAMQPYHRGTSYGQHPLWQIHELNNIDKHRKLTVCANFPAEGFNWFAKKVNVAHAAYFIPTSVHLDFNLPEMNAIFVRWAGRPDDPNQEMYIDLNAPLEPSFGEGHLGGEMVVPVLQALCDFVGNGVIVPLSKFL